MKSRKIQSNRGSSEESGHLIARIDPRARTLACILALAGLGGGWGVGAWVLAALAFTLSGEDLADMVKGLWPVGYLCLAGMILHGATIGGERLHPLLPLSAEGLAAGAKVASALLAASALAKLLVATTPTEELVASLDWLFRPLGRIGLPVKEFFSTVSVALSLVPDVRDAFFRDGHSNAGNREGYSGKLRFLLARAEAVSSHAPPESDNSEFRRFSGPEWLTLAAAFFLGPIASVLT